MMKNPAPAPVPSAPSQSDYDAYRDAKGKPRRDVALIGDAEVADLSAAQRISDAGAA